MTPIETFSALHTGVKIWLVWLLALQLGAIFFWRRPEARWVLAGLCANIVSMSLLHQQFGPGEHMSLPHLVVWTTLLIYLFIRRGKILQQGKILVIWLSLLSLSVGVSLILDLVLAIRFFSTL